MNDTHANPTAPAAVVPTTSPAVVRGISRAVALAGLGAGIGCAGVTLLAHRADWWPAFGAATIVSLIGAVGAVAVLSQAAGKSVDWLVTLVMGATAVRMLVSLFGLLVAIKAFHTPDEATAYMVCAYYAAMLIAETTLLARATRTPAASVAGGRNV